MVDARQRDHRETMGKRRKVLLELMRWPARGNEVHFVKIEAAVGGARHAKVSAVDGIERAAEQRDAARVMFRGGAVRLRCRQCASQGVSLPNFLMNSRYRGQDGQKDQRKGRRASSRHPKRAQGSHEESCPGRRRWTARVLSRPLRLRRKWDGIPSRVPGNKCVAPPTAHHRSWHPAWWQLPSSVFALMIR